MRKTLKLAIQVNLQVTFSQNLFYQISQNMTTDLHILNQDYHEIKEEMNTAEFSTNSA